MKLILLFVAVAGLSFGSFGNLNEGDFVEPENSIKDVMKKAHMGADGILNKIKKDEATDEEKAELLNLYIDMLESEPPKGEKEDWEAANHRIIVAAAKVVLGREKAVDQLVEATNCKACHDNHK